MTNRELLNTKLKKINDSEELVLGAKAFLKTDEQVLKMIEALESGNIKTSDDVLFKILEIYHGRDVRKK